MEHQELVRTVIHGDESYAFFTDETEAANYAVRNHASLGPLMTKERAHEMVLQTAPANTGHFDIASVTYADPNGLDWSPD